MKQLVLATRNQNKIKEIKNILGNLDAQILTLDDFPLISPIVEDGQTMEENALKKAHTVFQQTRLPVLADDSGLEVFYLAKRPGVHSARYAGENATYEENNKKLLKELKGVPSRRRNAQFRCVIAFVAEGEEKIVEGNCEGKIIEEPRGSNGFGYDPIFQPTGYTQTYAEMPLQLKNKISHRAKALEKIKLILIQRFSSP